MESSYHYTPPKSSFDTPQAAIEAALQQTGVFAFNAPGFTVCRDCFGLRAYADDQLCHIDAVHAALSEFYEADLVGRSYGAEWKLKGLEVVA